MHCLNPSHFPCCNLLVPANTLSPLDYSYSIKLVLLHLPFVPLHFPPKKQPKQSFENASQMSLFCSKPFQWLPISEQSQNPYNGQLCPIGSATFLIVSPIMPSPSLPPSDPVSHPYLGLRPLLLPLPRMLLSHTLPCLLTPLSGFHSKPFSMGPSLTSQPTFQKTNKQTETNTWPRIPQLTT